jgi:hypothetical protein
MMKLRIKEVPEVVREEDKKITFSLEQQGDNINLVLQKEGHVSQTVISFSPDGTVKRLSVYTDIGFKTIEHLLHTRKLEIQ